MGSNASEGVDLSMTANRQRKQASFFHVFFHRLLVEGAAHIKSRFYDLKRTGLEVGLPTSNDLIN